MSIFDPATDTGTGPVPSPCINVCKIRPDTGLCEGCLRTIDEIRRWRDTTEDDKRAIWRCIKERESTLFS